MTKEELRALPPTCAACEDLRCRGGTDCYGVAERLRSLQAEADDATRRLTAAAAWVEATGYNQWPRALEIVRFAERAGFSHLGLAYCIGLAAEARTFAAWLAPRFQVSSVCCKVGALPKADVGLPHVHEAARHESQCSPRGQADLLNEAGTELNIVIGLCVGHDALFGRASAAPVTTLLVKDRVLAHNPAGALYSSYWRKRLDRETR